MHFITISIGSKPIAHTSSIIYYRLQRSCGQGNIFTSVCHSVHRGVYLVLGVYLVGGYLVRGSGLGGPGLGAWSGGVSGLGDYLPKNFFFLFLEFLKNFLILIFYSFGDHPPPTPKADSGIWSTSSRYASYWNAFLFYH